MSSFSILLKNINKIENKTKTLNIKEMDNQLTKELNLSKLIGRGGFGDVYRAINNQEGRMEAVKISHSNNGQ
jgi:serine/threonine protein kinase